MQRRAGFLFIFPVPTDIQHLARIRRIHRSKQHRLAESHLSKNERWATRPINGRMKIHG